MTTNETTIFRRVESLSSFLHRQQSCELIATGLPFHMSKKGCHLLVFGILTNNPSTTVFLPYLLQEFHQSHHITDLWGKMVGLLMMGGSHIYWKLGMEILDYCTEEMLIGTYLCKRLRLGKCSNNIFFLQQTCSMVVLFLEYI